MRKNAKILLVEDDLINQKVEKIMMEKIGATVVIANNAKEARNQFDDSFDLIIFDIGLPDENGCELAKDFRKQNPTIPMIALTGHVAGPEHTDCYKAGVNDIITKPILLEHLKNKLEEYL